MVGIYSFWIEPRKAGKLEGGHCEEPTASQRERDSPAVRVRIKLDGQRVNAFPVSWFSEEFEYEVPFAWFGLVRNELRPLILAARARWTNPPVIVNLHPNIQGGRTASLEAHFDEAPTVGVGNENRGPFLRPVHQYRPPRSANACKPREGVHAVTCARWCKDLEDCEEHFDGYFIDGTEFGER